MGTAKVHPAGHWIHGEQLSMLEPNVDPAIEQAKDFCAERDKKRKPRLASVGGKLHSTSS